MSIAPILASAFLASIVTGFVTFYISERILLVKNVTQERTKWRDKIRRINVGIQKAYKEKDFDKIRRYGSYLRLAVNPIDELDQDILKEIKVLCNDPKDDDIERFSKKLSLLLKHDWERAKKEAAPFYKRLFIEVHRITYKQYLDADKNNFIQGNKMEKCFYKRFEFYFSLIAIIISIMALVVSTLNSSYFGFTKAHINAGLLQCDKSKHELVVISNTGNAPAEDVIVTIKGDGEKSKIDFKGGYENSLLKNDKEGIVIKYPTLPPQGTATILVRDFVLTNDDFTVVYKTGIAQIVTHHVDE